MTIELADILKIIEDARNRIGVQVTQAATPDGQPANPPGWETNNGFLGDPGITTVPDGAAAAQIPGKAETHVAGPPGPALPGDAPGFGQQPVVGGDPVGYGHHSTLTPEQASAFQMMMLIQGHNGDTVGRGRVVPHPYVAPAPNARTPNTGREQVAGA